MRYGVAGYRRQTERETVISHLICHWSGPTLVSLRIDRPQCVFDSAFHICSTRVDCVLSSHVLLAFAKKDVVHSAAQQGPSERMERPR